VITMADFTPAHHGRGVMQDLLQRHGQGVGVAQRGHAQRIAHQDHGQPGLIHQARRGGIVRGQHGQPLLAFGGANPGCGPGGAHGGYPTTRARSPIAGKQRQALAGGQGGQHRAHGTAGAGQDEVRAHIGTAAAPRNDAGPSGDAGGKADRSRSRWRPRKACQCPWCAARNDPRRARGPAATRSARARCRSATGRSRGQNQHRVEELQVRVLRFHAHGFGLVNRRLGHQRARRAAPRPLAGRRRWARRSPRLEPRLRASSMAVRPRASRMV
jgi:hypothetical protein